jgi:S1-C subfamily serine protease
VIDIEIEEAASTETVVSAPTRSRSKRRVVVVGAVAVAAALVVAVSLVRRPSSSGPTDKQVASTVQAAIEKAFADAANDPPRSTVAYQTILPSLVVIQTESAGTADDSRGIGTAVVINANGQMLTAFHVVDGASVIRVSFADGSESSATVLSSQPERDIAVLVAEKLPETVVPAVMAGGVRVGDEVYAVGHPFGLVGSLSAGVVSGLDRSTTSKNGRNLDGLIQFDAAVNPGNSGGPLLNRNGQVVGIVTGLANPSEQASFAGIGFAIPIATAGGAAGGPSL